MYIYLAMHLYIRTNKHKIQSVSSFFPLIVIEGGPQALYVPE